MEGTGSIIRFLTTKTCTSFCFLVRNDRVTFLKLPVDDFCFTNEDLLSTGAELARAVAKIKVMLKCKVGQRYLLKRLPVIPNVTQCSEGSKIIFDFVILNVVKDIKLNLII